MFCDQTAHTVARHSRTTAARATERYQNGSSEGSTPTDGVSAYAAKDMLLAVRPEFAAPNIDTFALAYCYEHHVMKVEASAASHGVTNDVGLLACMRALGMASYSASQHSAKAALHAREYYIMAVKSTNSALTNPDCAQRDDTLLTVIMLAYFECHDTNSLEQWTRHIEGTAALLHLRGRAQIATSDGCILFMQASTNIISMCFRNGRRLPKHVRDTMAEGSKHMKDCDDPLWRVHSAMMEVADFYSDAVNGHLTNPGNTIEHALRLDSELTSAFASTTPAWRYETKSTVDSNAQVEYPGHFDIYQNSLAAQVWNSARNGRIICHLIILATLRRYTTTHMDLHDRATQLQESAAVISRLSTDIIASVPQHVGCARSIGGGLERIPGPGSGVTKVLDYKRSRLPVLRTATGYFLVWCLGLVGKAASPGSQIRIAAYENLRIIGEVLAVKQAFFFADALEQDRPSSQDRLKKAY